MSSEERSSTDDPPQAEAEASRATASPVDLRALARAAGERIAREARARPITAVAVAVGVGYVLGRGLPSAVVRLGLAAGVRVATESLLTSTIRPLLSAEAGNAGDAGEPDSSEDGGVRARRANGRFHRTVAAKSAEGSAND